MKKTGIKFVGSKGEFVTIDLGCDGLGDKCFILNSNVYPYKDCISPWSNMNLRLVYSCTDKRILREYAQKHYDFTCVSISITYSF